MSVFHYLYPENKFKIHACGLVKNKKCPDPVTSDEPPIAEELRSILSGNIYISDDKVGYTFINRLTTYPPDSCMTCEAYTQNIFHMVTINELMKNSGWLKVNNQYLYPMLIWAMKNDKPVLVRVSPGKKKPVKVIKNSSPGCLAYIICTAR